MPHPGHGAEKEGTGCAFPSLCASRPGPSPLHLRSAAVRVVRQADHTTTMLRRRSRWPIVGPPRQLAHGGRHSISIHNGMTGLPSVPDDSLPNLQTHIPGTEKRPVLNRSESEGYLGVGRMPCSWDCRKFRFQASSHPMEMVGNEKETVGISSKS